MPPDTFLHVDSLVVATGQHVPDFTLTTPLNLVTTGRESSATTTMLTLAGRMKPREGSIVLRGVGGEELSTPRSIAQQVALAGVPDIDGLDRNVSAATYIREVSAWSAPWYRCTPRDVDQIERWKELAELFALEFDPALHVGKLGPADRFLLRVALALLARPEPALVIIDDIDQVRSGAIRADLISQLRRLSERVPVLVASTNPDEHSDFDTVISLDGGSVQ